MSAALIRVLGLLVTLTARDIHGFSQGAPPTQCGAMMPNHGAAPQSGAAPYLLTPSKFTYSPMEQITVRLIPNGVEGFKGFLLEARDGGQPVGRFITNPQNAYQALDCGGLAGTALTHTSGFTQNAVEVIWEAPSGPPASGNGIKFRATIVRSFPEFWVGVETQELTYQQTNVQRNSFNPRRRAFRFGGSTGQ